MRHDSDKKESILRNSGVQTILASLLCIILGLLVGYVVLLIINPGGAGKAILAIIKNFLYYPQLKPDYQNTALSLRTASGLRA